MTGTTARWIAARMAFIAVAACLVMYIGNEAMAFGHMVTHIRHPHAHSATHHSGPTTQLAVERPDPAGCPASLGTLRTGGDRRAASSTDCATPARPHHVTTAVARARTL